jgi:Rieske Fe-S protein
MSETANKGTAAPDGRPLSEQPAWRQDFPIDWPQDHYVARREFTKFLMLTSLPFALVQLCLALVSWCRRDRRRSPVKPIAALAEIPIGGVLCFEYPGAKDPCLLVRLNEETLRAFSQKCTHLGCAVTPDADKNCLYCPCHKGYFALDSGRPLAGPPRRPLPSIALENRDGVVYAVGVEV